MKNTFSNSTGWLSILFALTGCLTPNDAPPQEHPCQVQNHCLHDPETNESTCEEGYEWEDLNDSDNYNCVLDSNFETDAGTNTGTNTGNNTNEDVLSTPSNPNPAQGASDVNASTNLSWTVSTSDGSAILCDVWINGGGENLTFEDLDTFNVAVTKQAGTSYEWGVECTNGTETRASPTWSFTTACHAPAPCPDLPTMTDDDGNTYATVQICNQCWMAENMNIGYRVDAELNGQLDNDAIERFCPSISYLQNSETGCDTYGGLYQWDEAMYHGERGDRGICPPGWHVPTDSDWQTLEKALGMPANEASEYTTGMFRRGEDAAVGSQLVSGGSSGFNALLSGSAMEVMGGNYGASAAGTAGYFWTSTSVSSNAIYRSIFDDEPEVQRKNEKKTAALSVRCIKN